MLTEKEAGVKQCCGPDGCGYHNDQPYPARWCIASACMAWRWENSATRRDGLPDDDNPRGYCGLAGRTS